MATLAPSVASLSSEKSTIVRSSSVGVRWPLRALLSTAQSLAPSLAAAVAERMFLTPPRHDWPPHERDALARGEEFSIAAAGHDLRAWRFGAGPTVLLVHGWGGRGGQMAPYFEPLEYAGLSAVAFDGPAHGASTGRLASVPVFADAVTAVGRRLGARAVIAHSMGAAALAIALGRGLDVDAAVLVAPPRSPAAFLEGFSRALGLRAPIASAVEERLERRFGIPIADLQVTPYLSAAAVPVLVVHDMEDREVPWADGAALAAACPTADLVTTHGLGHRRVLRDPAVVRRIVEFVGSHVTAGRRPSAAVGALSATAGEQPSGIAQVARATSPIA